MLVEGSNVFVTESQGTMQWPLTHLIPSTLRRSITTAPTPFFDASLAHTYVYVFRVSSQGLRVIGPNDAPLVVFNDTHPGFGTQPSSVEATAAQTRELSEELPPLYSGLLPSITAPDLENVLVPYSTC